MVKDSKIHTDGERSDRKRTNLENRIADTRTVARDTTGRLLQRITQTRDTHTEVLSEPSPLNIRTGALQERYCIMTGNAVTLTAEELAKIKQGYETLTEKLTYTANLGNCIIETSETESTPEGGYTDMARLRERVYLSDGSTKWATGMTKQELFMNVAKILAPMVTNHRKHTDSILSCTYTAIWAI